MVRAALCLFGWISRCAGSAQSRRQRHNGGGLSLRSLLKMSRAFCARTQAMPVADNGHEPDGERRGEHHASIAGGQHRHRPDQRKDRLHLQFAGAGRLHRQRRQRHDPLCVRLQLERLARTAVVHVRHPGDVRRLLYVQAQRACPGRNLLSVSLRARTALARPDRHAVLPDPGLPAARLSVLAVLPSGLRRRRNVGQCRRPDPLADQIRDSRPAS